MRLPAWSFGPLAGRFLLPAAVVLGAAALIAWAIDRLAGGGLVPGWGALVGAGVALAGLAARLAARRAPLEAGHRLAAVLFADIVDYSALAARDESRALVVVRHFQSAARRATRHHGGRIVKFMGDGVFSEFASTQAAVEAALDLRSALSGGQAPVCELRVGVHVGDLAPGEGGDLYGDDVNVAARIERVAEPGQVLVSEDVWRQLHQRSELGFRALGPTSLKGVGELDLYEVTGNGSPREAPARIPGPVDLPSAWRLLTDRRWLLGGAAVFGAAILAVVLLRDGGRSPVSGGALVEGLAPGVAVLPFGVSGGAEEDWGEGMVDLLAVSLAGVPGLRSIPSQTVWARWREREAEPVELPSVLDVARRTGARYAVVGNVLRLGPQMRLTFSLYDTERGVALGNGRVDGHPDSLISLADRLTIQILELVPVEGRDPRASVNLAAATTDSLEALKAYLEGEARFRRSDYDAAFERYGRAVEIDSTFALALFRQAMVAAYSDLGLARELIERAAHHLDRLPSARERTLVTGALARQRGSLAGLDDLQQAARIHPEDVEIWYQLGETAYHLGAQGLLPEEVADQAFARAAALDSTFSVVYPHLIENAFGLHADSARARRLIDAYDDYSANDRDVALYRDGYVLAFGTGPAAASVLSRLTIDNAWFLARGLFWHPRFLPLQARVLEGRTSSPRAPDILARNALARGRLTDAARWLRDGDVSALDRAGLLATAAAWGLPVPADELAAALEALEGDRSPPALFYVGAAAVEAGREDRVEEIRGELVAQAADRLAAGDTVGSEAAAGVDRALAGLAAWKEGRHDSAVRALEPARQAISGFWDDRETVNGTIRVWLATIHEERGAPGDAVRVLRSFWGQRDPWKPIARGRLARLLRATDPAAADRALEFFTRAWRDPDPALAPLVPPTEPSRPSNLEPRPEGGSR